MNEKEISVKSNVKDGITTLKMLIRHPMETGQRKNEDGNIIPLNFITKVTILTENNQIIFTANWGASIAKDPILAIRSKILKKGDKFIIVWQNNEGKEQKFLSQVE